MRHALFREEREKEWEVAILWSRQCLSLSPFIVGKTVKTTIAAMKCVRVRQRPLSDTWSIVRVRAALPLSLVSMNRKERDPWEYEVTDMCTNAFEFSSASMVEFDGIE